MSRLPIRLRLTAWYLVALTLAIVAVGGGSLWLMRWSLLSAADAHLTARVEGVRQFLASMERELSPTAMQDEFNEYAELTLGETLIDVTDESGGVLYRPTTAHWADLHSAARQGIGPSVRIAEGTLAGDPMRVATSVLALRDHRYEIVAALPMAATNEALERFELILAGLLPMLAALAGIGGYWISRRALAPVDRIAQAAREVTVHHLDRRLEVPQADDELRRLAVTFNDMLARLETAVAEMTRLTAEAAHELRTPVTLVRTTAEIALTHDRSPAEYRQALSDVVHHSEHLSSLVGDLLLLARDDAGVEHADGAPTDLAALVHDIVRDSGPMAHDRDLTLQCTQLDRLEVVGHGPSLRRLVLILIDNAIKYSRPGGSVETSVRAQFSHGVRTARIAVVDQGIGLEPHEGALVFDRFFRGANARGSTEGSGLGLSIARTIVARHRGTIQISGGPNNVGCQVIVTLPLT
ncbi:MAG TPA: ATP-binding protein [Vicinamibacterales bacterium]|nr:ATP-binding protein [Vicinamibacterales bacterium]